LSVEKNPTVVIRKPATGDSGPPREDSDPDMEAICDGISRVIIKGLVNEEPAPEVERPLVPEAAAMAETGLIAPLGDMVTEEAVSRVGSLLDSDEVSDAIVRVAREKVEQVLSEDLATTESGPGRAFAELVRQECARYFGRENFRQELVKFLRREVREDVRRMVNELTELLFGRISEVLNQVHDDMNELSAPILTRLADLQRTVAELKAERARNEPPRERRPAAAVHAERIRDRLWAEGLL
jgi:hypothetical protein